MLLHPLIVAYAFTEKTMQAMQHALKTPKFDMETLNTFQDCGKFRASNLGNESWITWKDNVGNSISFDLDPSTGIPLCVNMGKHKLVISYSQDGCGNEKFTLTEPNDSSCPIVFVFDENGKIIQRQSMVEKYRYEYFNEQHYMPEAVTWLERIGEPDHPDYPARYDNQTDVCGWSRELVDSEGNYKIEYDDTDSFAEKLTKHNAHGLEYTVDLAGLSNVSEF